MWPPRALRSASSSHPMRRWSLKAILLSLTTPRLTA
nr:MAG TPA: hypothetical protein [Caudoviricetes sp.]